MVKAARTTLRRTYGKVIKMANVKHVSNYTNVYASWSKTLGPKPTEAQLALAHVFGKPGKQSLAVAMALRADGVTGSQIKQASGLFDGKFTPQLNHMRELITGNCFTREAVPGKYVLTLAPKGQQFIDLHGAKAAAKVTAAPVKAAAKAAKPRKAKAVKVEPVADMPVEPVIDQAAQWHADSVAE